MKADALRILNLQVENILRVVAVNITPNGRVIEITGRNRQGKSSALDALWMAFGGEKAIPSVPIHEGAEEGHVIVDVGGDAGVKYKVTRRLRKRPDGSIAKTLTVESPDGARFQKPQEILNGLVGALSMDPGEFLRMQPKGQAEILKQLVPDLDFEAIEKAHQDDFDRRTDVNRRLGALRAQADAIKLPADIPQFVDETGLLDQLQRAADTNSEIERQIALLNTANESIRRDLDQAATCRHNADDLRRQAEAEEAKAKRLEQEAQTKRENLANAPKIGEPVDTAALRTQIADAKRNNEIAALAQRKVQILDQAGEAERESRELTDRIQRRKDEKAASIAAAKMPVEGLSITDDCVMLGDFPLSQASGAQQLRVSVAIAASLNPQLRFVRIKDASLLDGDSWDALAELAEEMNLQVFAETVQSGRPGAVVIEDGHVRQPVAIAAE